MCGSRPSAEPGRASPPTSATRAPTCLILSLSKDGAICPARGTGAALAMLFADTQAMQAHLEEIARTVARGAHAVLLLDRAGWHTSGALAVPKNITLILLPSRAPELNPVENIWQYLRQTWLSNRVFDTYDDIIDAACNAWRRLIAQPGAITSISSREWALSWTLAIFGSGVDPECRLGGHVIQGVIERHGCHSEGA